MPTNSSVAPTTDEALAAADQLVAEGRRLEAITVLTERNRVERDPAIERRLVQLRHSAFVEVPTAPGRESWPPEMADPFPDLKDAPPEVTPDELTSEVLGGSILNHGCVIVRGLVAQERLDLLMEDIDRAFDSVDEFVEKGAKVETTPWFAPFKPDKPYSLGYGRQWVINGGGVWTVDSPRSFFDLMEAIEEVGLGDTIAGYLGERPAISVKKSTLRRVPIDTGTDWHQDGSFLGEGIRTVNLWLALTSCGADAPSLDIVPRRLDEIAPTGTDGAHFDWSVGPGMVDQVAEGSPILRPSFEPGDAILFDEKFLHRTGVSPGMTNPRYAIESWFFAPSTYPHGQVPVAF
jgi:hypothetical protein